MKNRRKILETQQLDEVGGEPLEGSGFEGELPESTIGPDLERQMRLTLYDGPAPVRANLAYDSGHGRGLPSGESRAGYRSANTFTTNYLANPR